MNKEQQRIKIAEACGWTEIEPCTCHDHQSRGYETTKVGHKKHLPDYLNDLNAMHEAEKTLSENDRQKYLDILADAPRDDRYLTWADGIFATAAQKAEAFLKTLNLWKE